MMSRRDAGISHWAARYLHPKSSLSRAHGHECLKRRWGQGDIDHRLADKPAPFSYIFLVPPSVTGNIHGHSA